MQPPEIIWSIFGTISAGLSGFARAKIREYTHKSEQQIPALVEAFICCAYSPFAMIIAAVAGREGAEMALVCAICGIVGSSGIQKTMTVWVKRNIADKAISDETVS